MTTPDPRATAQIRDNLLYSYARDIQVTDDQWLAALARNEVDDLHLLLCPPSTIPALQGTLPIGTRVTVTGLPHTVLTITSVAVDGSGLYYVQPETGGPWRRLHRSEFQPVPQGSS